MSASTTHGWPYPISTDDVKDYPTTGLALATMLEARGAHLVTAFPGAPSDGDEIAYVDSLAAPTFVWRLRYILAATKWLYLGGIPKRTEAAASVNSAAASGAWSAALGQAIVVPKAGDYLVGWGGHCGGNSSGANGYLGLGVSGAPGEYIQVNNTTVGQMYRRLKHTLAAAASLDLYIEDSDSTRRIAWDRRFIEVEPVLIG